MAIFGGWRLTKAGILFIVGIILLGGLVTGGIFLVKNRGEAVRRDEAIKVAQQNLEDQSKVATQPVNVPSASEDTTKTETPASTDAAAPQADVTELPETGMDDILAIGRVAMVAVLAFSVASYIASRRAGQHL
jgi:FtsZ-interacting cell division protein ZipA